MSLLKLLGGLCAATCLALPAVLAAAQAFPVAGKPIRILVPYPPGGYSDHQARIIATKLGEIARVPVVVEHKPGASTLIATREAIGSMPDGHTLLLTNQVVVMLPHLYRTPPYSLLRDLTPVAQVAVSGLVLVAHESLPARNAAELIAYLKSSPEKPSYASAGSGSLPHLAGILLARAAGVELQHVPYKGSADLMRDLMAGRVQLSFDMAISAIGSTGSGRVRMIAAATDRRLAALPGLPTLRESGIDIAGDTWLALFAPPGMAPAVLDALSEQLLRALRDPETRRLFATGAAEITALPPAEFLPLLRRSDARWGAEIRALGVTLD
jgi:tripartite-type tricarboxylate transporter receptor subunit TctC